MPNEHRPENRATAGTGRSIGWADILEHWPLVVRDLAEHARVDVYDPALDARPWPWLRTHILGLLDIPSRLTRALSG